MNEYKKMVNKDLDSLIGLTKEEALKRFKNSRFVVRVFDEEHTCATADYSKERINLYTQDGKVIRATVG